MKRCRFTLEDLKKSKVAHLNQHLFVEPNKMVKEKKLSKEKAFIQAEVEAWCANLNTPLETEYHFHGVRRWRFDWAAPDMFIAWEYEGLMARKSRHTTIKGYSGDTEKYNEAARLGWKVFRYTALTYENIVNDLKELI